MNTVIYYARPIAHLTADDHYTLCGLPIVQGQEGHYANGRPLPVIHSEASPDHAICAGCQRRAGQLEAPTAKEPAVNPTT